ncbi:bifunctional DNA-binding transcriptional regulator/antitoxin component of YhaV-PrlF toxin-antitoxin module [Constrictibacter sp. MBR-5]|jgi:bifunctional DNA-binding transcriptional regulator/antitoxin component of YhaV-PrlF toxin-antitoxin module|uniref:hypothetical protein n=1 Tax=Constrictibacter sp. MBR-5 TaxID=3156467 RepID=UPI003391AB58
MILIVEAGGQILLPDELLEHLGVKAGGEISVALQAQGRIVLRSAERTASIKDFFGCLDNEDGPSLSLEEIETATRQGWAGER